MPQSRKSGTGLWPILAVLVLAAAPAWPQSRMMGADLEGTVRDDTGAVLPGATVTATNVETDLVRDTTSDSAGRFLLPALPPGVYRMTAELFGFGTRTRENVALLLGQAARVDFALGLSGKSETVTVTDGAPVLDARRTAVATVIGTRQIDNLPISGRNFIAFAVLTPGVTTDRGSPGISATTGLSFTGQSARSNNIMVDGFDNNDSTVGGVRSLFSQEAVREFQVLTDSYSAEFGNASGGVVNIMTRNGTNEVHGKAFAFVRDDTLNAREYFESHDAFGNEQRRAKAPFRQAQWGATLSGPIRRGKTFFFLSFERGDTDASNSVTISPEVASVLQAGGFPVETDQVPYRTYYTQALAKLDHQWNPRSSLVLRASASDSRDENADRFGGTVARSRASALARKDWFGSVAQTNVLSDRWLNEARLQGARFRQITESLDPTCSGPCDALDEGGPSVTLPGLASVGRASGTPAPRINNRVQVGDTLSYFSGGHLFKAGLDVDLTDTRVSSLPSYFGGSYVFSTLPGSALTAVGLPARPQPVSPLEAFSLGLPAAYTQGYGQPSISYVHKELAAFMQDEWRATARLTLRAGLRYQRQFWAPRHFRVSNVGGSTFEYDFPQDRNNLGPRLGVSWDVRGDGRTWLHGGYGRFFADNITAAAGVPDIIDGSEHVRIYTRVFPATVAAWRAAGHHLAEPTTGAPTVVTVDPGLETPYAHQVALGADQAMGADFVLGANLIYVRGHRQLGTIDYNPLVPALGPGRRPNDVEGRAGTSASVLQYTSFGESWYKGLALSLTKRFSHGYEFMASYTLSKADDTLNDYTSSPQSAGRGRNPADPFGLPLGFDPTLEKGPSYNDQRHRFVLSGIYQMPWRLQMSGVFTAASGRPFSPLAGDGTFDRARLDPADPLTSVGRNSALTDAQVTLDLRLSRTFKLRGRGTLEAIGDVFNVFNAVNVADVNNVFGRGAYPSQPATDSAGRVTYGLYQRVLPPRQVQLALRLGF